MLPPHPIHSYNPYRYEASPTATIPHYTERHIIPLSDPQDDQVLSEFLTFVRADCLEIFDSSNEGQSLSMAAQSLSQVGVRCRFCAHIGRRSRAPRSQSFPSTLSRIYQSLTMMIRDHFPNCKEMPEETKTKFHTLKRKPKNVGHCVVTSSGDGGSGKKKKKNANRLSGAGSGLGNAARYTKNYWTESAQRIGLYDSPDGNGIRYHNIMGIVPAPPAILTSTATPAPVPAASTPATSGLSGGQVPPMQMADEDTEEVINAAIDAAETAREESAKKRKRVNDAAKGQEDPIEADAV